MRLVFQLQWFGIYELQGVLTRWPGFLLQDCRWLFLGPSLLSWMPIRSRHCCEEPGRVLVWIVIAATVTSYPSIEQVEPSAMRSFKLHYL